MCVQWYLQYGSQHASGDTFPLSSHEATADWLKSTIEETNTFLTLCLLTNQHTFTWKWKCNKEENSYCSLHMLQAQSFISVFHFCPRAASIPVVSTPFLPARPAICLYVSGSNKRPLKVGVRMMTLRAGRLTPEERVEVAARTLTMPWRKAPSNTSRSSNVRPTGNVWKRE